jgi:NAD(P)H-hydrate epimerase
MKYIGRDILKKVYKSRKSESHKYDYGYLIVVGGSTLYTGSPALVAMAALRAGVDLTLILAPKKTAKIIASFSRDLIAYALNGYYFGEEHLPELLSLVESANKVSSGKAACVIGGGLGKNDTTEKAISQYLSNPYVPVVIDADAIWAVSKQKEVLKGKKMILTPHSYEFYILSGIDVTDLKLEDKTKVVKNVAANLGTVILLKGNPDIISDGKEVFLNKTGCPEMTVGGTGDTLAGICGCFLAQGFEPILAASGGAYINGLAGEKAKEKLGVSLLATDLINEIPNVIK